MWDSQSFELDLGGTGTGTGTSEGEAGGVGGIGTTMAGQGGQLTVEVWDHDLLGSDDFLGQVIIPAGDFQRYGRSVGPVRYGT